MKCAYALTLILFCSVSSFGADPEPYLKGAPMPFYPPVARGARVQGKVFLLAKVNQDGEVTHAEVVEGHPLLKDAALANVQAWKFGWPSPCACTVEKRITFVYRMSDKPEDANSPTSTVHWYGTSRVEIDVDGPIYVNY